MVLTEQYLLLRGKNPQVSMAGTKRLFENSWTELEDRMSLLARRGRKAEKAH